MSDLFPTPPVEIVLRDYQDMSIDQLRAHLRAGLKNLVLCIATGGGKTVCASHLLKEAFTKGKRALFVVDRISLINQTSAMLEKYGIPHGVIQADHWRKNDELVQVASAQTLCKRGWPEADLIIIDECHTMFKHTMDHIAQRKVPTIGLSATPFSSGLGKYYDAVVNVTTTNKLTNEGHLVPFKIFAASEPDMTGAKVSCGEWTEDECALRSMPIVGDAVREYLKHGDEAKFIAFGCTINHCEELRRQFLGAGVRVELYTADTPDDERDIIVAEFRRPDSSIRGLISVAALAKGFDVPDVEVIIMCRPLRKSLTEHIQILGRGLRPHPGKPICTVLDHSGNCLRFWEDMHEFFEDGIAELDDGKKKEKKKPEKKDPVAVKCPICFAVHRAAPACPECGHEYPRKKKVQHVAGELHELGAVTGTKADKQLFYSQLLFIANDRQYSKGWAAHKYRARFGVWPRNLDETPTEPSREVLGFVRSQAIAYHKAKEKQDKSPLQSMAS